MFGFCCDKQGIDKHRSSPAITFLFMLLLD
jgi:hypothetical protein